MAELSLNNKKNALCVTQPPWPNGYGIGLLSRGLWVRVPPGVTVFLILFYPHQEHKEDKEDVGKEEDGTEKLIGALNIAEVEIAENHPEFGNIK